MAVVPCQAVNPKHFSHISKSSLPYSNRDFVHIKHKGTKTIPNNITRNNQYA